MNACYTHSIMEALNMIREKTYTLIIMDVLLSQNGGLDVLREIRQMDETPILALSEQASASERVLALNCGADDVLNKPYVMRQGQQCCFCLYIFSSSAQKSPESTVLFYVTKRFFCLNAPVHTQFASFLACDPF